MADPLIIKFNERFPAGSKVRWRPAAVHGVPYETMTVKYPAYDNYGQPVVFFYERSGCCSIEPDFVDYSATFNNKPDPFTEGYAQGLEAAANIAESIDSKRGNEMEIANALRDEAKRVRAEVTP